MLAYTGHPFIDVGIAAITAQAGKFTPDQLTADDLAAVVEYIEQNYIVPPLRTFDDGVYQQCLVHPK